MTKNLCMKKAKICSSCKDEKNIKEFRKNGKYFASVCNTCAVENYRERHLMKTYGMTLEEYDIMLEQQDNVCKICSQLNKGNRRMCVDHCHTTGKIRGLLCDHCNTGLGKFFDNEELLLKAVKYLKNK